MIMTLSRELRIGNLVIYKNSVLPVCSIHEDDTLRLLYHGKSIGCFPSSFIGAVTITKERLLNLGFEKMETYVKYGNGADWQPEYPRSTFEAYNIDVNEDKCFSIVYEVNQWKNKDGEIESDNYMKVVFGDFYPTKIDSSDFIACIIPDYVHQLQNLYFALTGKELLCNT